MHPARGHRHRDHGPRPGGARDKAKFHLDFAYQSFREFQTQARLARNSKLYSSIYNATETGT